MSISIINSTRLFQSKASRVSIPSNPTPPNIIRETIPAYRLRANLRQAVLAALSTRLREHVNAPDQRAAACGPTPESTFSRICPLNPEPGTELVPTHAHGRAPRPHAPVRAPAPGDAGRSKPHAPIPGPAEPAVPRRTRIHVFANHPHEPGTQHDTRANPGATAAPTPHAPDCTPAPGDTGASTPHAPILGPVDPAIPRRTRIHVFANQLAWIRNPARRSRQPTRLRRANAPCTRPHTRPQRCRRINTPCTNSRTCRARHPAPNPNPRFREPTS
jgi:hypothetical protein